MATSDSTTSLKQCSRKDKCVHPLGSWQPATEEYFRVTRKDTGYLNSWCRACHKAYCKSYNKTYHPREDVKAHRREREHAPGFRERQPKRRYTKEQREHKHEYDQKRYAEKAPEILERTRQYSANNFEMVRARKREAYARNPQLYKMNVRKRQHVKRGLPFDFSCEDWSRALNYFNGCCAYCGQSPSLFDRFSVLHQEHYIPINAENCPGTVVTNIIPACQSCNFSKKDSEAVIWVARRFGKQKGKKIIERIVTYFGERSE